MLESYPVCILDRNGSEEIRKRLSDELDEVKAVAGFSEHRIVRDAVIIEANQYQHSQIKNVWPSVGCASCTDDNCRNSLMTIRRARCVTTLHKVLKDQTDGKTADVVNEAKLVCY